LSFKELAKMIAKKSMVSASVLVLAALSLLLSLYSCSFRPGRLELCKDIEQTPLTPVSGSTPSLVLEDPGTIIVLHGNGCAHTNKAPDLKVEQSVSIPSYANKAAVFLNGWKMGYSGGDHHVLGMTAAVGKINVQPGKVTWQAFGALGDSGFDKSIDWCYYYTVVAWNDTNLHAFVDQDDANYFCKGESPSGSDNFFYSSNAGTNTALASFASFLSNANFASSRRVALLPRGFGYDWFPDDHHILQVGYNMGHGETFIEDRSYKKAEGELHPLPTPPNGRVDSGFVSWITSAIFKDNDKRRDYNFGEFVSGMSGSDVDEIDPPFSILPIDGPGFFGACLGAPAGVQKQDVVIDNVPYAYAVPMLTGWDLSYGCMGDHHVREIGIWIDNLHYDRPPNASTGTLRYTVFSTLHDDSSNWGSSQYKVSILGLRRLAGGGTVKGAKP
jgi:hypothetical protein